jgi:hypothetical protein
LRHSHHDTGRRVDVALAEYTALRAKILSRQQAQSTATGVALTATAAILGFAVNKDGQLDILLVLPFVLSGLAIVYLNHGVALRILGRYIEQRLWPVLSNAIPPDGAGLMESPPGGLLLRRLA